MRKKFFSMSVAAVLAVVAFAAIPSMASAHEFGNCLKPLATAVPPPCIAKKVFTPFPEGTPVAITNKKAPLTGEFELKNETTPANAIDCTKLSGQGTAINIAGTGHNELNLVFEGCKGVGALAFCQSVVSGVAQKINGTGKIIGEVTTEAISATEVEVTVKSGFNISCTGGVPGATVDLGTTTGKIVGKAVAAPKNYETVFTEATGLKFIGKNSTQTGTSETVEAFPPHGKLYQN